MTGWDWSRQKLKSRCEEEWVAAQRSETQLNIQDSGKYSKIWHFSTGYFKLRREGEREGEGGEKNSEKKGEESTLITNIWNDRAAVTTDPKGIKIITDNIRTNNIVQTLGQ